MFRDMIKTKRAKTGITLMVAGFVAAIVAAHAYAGPGFGGRPDPEDRVKVMAKMLDLTPDQEYKVAQILKDEDAKRDEVRGRFTEGRRAEREEMFKLRDGTRNSINAVLNDNQRSKLEVLFQYRMGVAELDRPKGGRGGCDQDCDQEGGRGWGRCR